MKKTIAFLFLFFGTCLSVHSQATIPQSSVVVTRGTKKIDLRKFDELNITQNVVRNGTDSLTIEVDCDSIVRVGDTLIVRPWSITQERYAYDDKPSKIELTYDHPSANILKIPVKEVDKVKFKNQPFCLIMSSIIAVSYVGVMTGAFYPKGNDEQINTGTAILVASVPVLAVSFTCRLVFGKRKLRFDKQRTDKKTWAF
jgi:sporulation protein YlmC with PRC-barrel domain